MKAHKIKMLFRKLLNRFLVLITEFLVKFFGGVVDPKTALIICDKATYSKFKIPFYHKVCNTYRRALLLRRHNPTFLTITNPGLFGAISERHFILARKGEIGYGSRRCIKAGSFRNWLLFVRFQRMQGKKVVL